MEECMLLKGKSSQEEHLQKITVAVVWLSEAEMSGGIEQILPPSGNVMKNTCMVWDGRCVWYTDGMSVMYEAM